ncbi:hypothetical protein ZWY2020_039680 [Hordeum vulgare]|nr:hypothetical protein ZWY2020_039680 [Hordeum vulgare]
MASSGSSSSAARSSSRRGFGPPMRSPVRYRHGPLDYEPADVCDCKEKAAMWISWSDDNPGRRYFNYQTHCSFPFDHRGGCDYFSWRDDPIKDPFLKQLIVDLRDMVWMLERMNEHLHSAARTGEEEIANETRQLRDIIEAMNEGALAAERAASAVNGTNQMRIALLILVLAMLLYLTATR